VLLRVLPALLAIAAVGAGLAVREARPAADSEPAKHYSDKRSPCGRDAGVWASDLGLRRTRQVTLCMLNDERARAGLPGLREEGRLELAAQRYAREMVAGRFFAHESPAGTDPQARIMMAGYPAQAASSGENLAWGTGSEQSPAEIVDGWMHSPGHRANILRRAFTEVGIGVVFGIPEERPGAPPGATYATSFGGPPVMVPGR
jgi:Cysteine-rich secretory protein family